jgi:Tfp pilus assembly protein PilN
MSARPYQQINLYQPIFRKQRQIFSAMTMLQTLGVVVSALLTIYVYGLWQVRAIEGEALQLEGRERAYSTQIARLDPSSSNDQRRAAEQELQRLTATLASQQRLIEELQQHPLGSTQGFSELLTALARQRSRGLWLTEIAINRASNAIELVGQSISPDIVPTYLLKLGDEDALAGHRFDDFSIERSTETAAVTFRVSSRAVTERGPNDKVAQR